MPLRKEPASAVDSALSPVTEDETDRLLSLLAGYAHVAVGVSGGSDSMALMVLTAEWARRKSGPRLTVLTVDHGLRSDSAEEAAEVADRARGLGLDHEVLEWRGAKPRTGIQEAARQARYSLMTRWCRDAGADALAVAHTLDDQAETVIMRLARGSGLDGLAGMASVTERDGVRLLRPFLSLRRGRLRATLAARGHAWVDDPSNLDERYERVRVRGVIEALEDLGLSVEALGRSASRLGDARVAVEAATAAAMADIVTCFDAGFVTVGLEAFARTVPEIGIRVLGRCLQAVGGRDRAPSREALARLDGALRGETGRSWTLGGCVIRRRQGNVVICRESGRRAPPPVALADRPEVLWDGRFRLVATGGKGRGLTVRALDAAGWALLGRSDRLRKSLPAYVGRSLVSLWSGDRLVSVPHMELPCERPVEAAFQARGLLAGAACQRLIDADVTTNLLPRPIITAGLCDA